MKWPVAPLVKIVRIVGGGTPTKANGTFWSGEIPWVSPKDMVSRDIWETQDHISENAVAESATQLVPAGSVLIVARSGILARFVPIAIARVPVTLNQDMKAFLPATEALDNQFLAYFLESRSTELLASFVKLGATVHSLDMNKLQHLQVPIPPLLEQRRIVEILDQADALRKKRTESDAKTERVLPALFSKMFGDLTTNPKGWEFTTLCDGGALVRYGLGQPPKGSPNGIPLIRATNIRRGTISDDEMMFVSRADVPESRNAFLSADEVIVVRSGAYTGDVAQVTERWAGSVAGYDLVITPGESFCGEYIEAYLLTPHIQKNYFGNLKARAGQPHLNASQLSATPILRPPKSLQLRFAEHVRQIRCLQEQFVKSSREVGGIFNTLLYRAFSGDLTAKWRDVHMKELLAEMKEQAKYLVAHAGHGQRENPTLQESLFRTEPLK